MMNMAKVKSFGNNNGNNINFGNNFRIITGNISNMGDNMNNQMNNNNMGNMMINNMMKNNQMNNNIDNTKQSDDNFNKELELDNETYILKIKKIKPSRISMKCENKFDYLSLYYYSINLSYEEFCKLARTFRLFDNIDEIFDTIKNLIKGINYSFRNDGAVNQYLQQPPLNNLNSMSNNSSTSNRLNDEEQNVKLVRSENDSINLILKIPLLNEKYEKIKIEFKKENRDLKQQFEKIKEKFLKIKKIAFSNETQINMNNSFGNINICLNNNLGNMNNMNMNNLNNNMNKMNIMNNNMGKNIIQSRQTGVNQSAENILSQIKKEFLNNS